MSGSEEYLKPHSRESWDTWSRGWDDLIRDWKNPHSIYYASCSLHIADFLPQKGLVLSLGCGTAECALRLRREGITIVCTDFSKGMLAKASENHRSDYKGHVFFVLCDAQHPPFKDSVFGLVYARGALLSYVPVPLDVLTEAHRMLVPGGVAAFDAMNWGKESTGSGYGSLSREDGDRISLFHWRNQDKKQIKETIYLDPKGRVAALLGEDKSIRFLYPSRQPPRGVLDEINEDHQDIGVMKAKSVKATDFPVYLIFSEEKLRRAVEFETVDKKGKIAWCFEPEDLKRPFQQAGFKILRMAPLGNLHRIVTGVPPSGVPGLTDFARQNLDKIAAIEKALHDQLSMEKAAHLFIAGRKD